MELPLPLSLVLQSSIDALVKADPDLLSQLHDLQGKVLRLQVQAPDLTVTLGFVDTGVELMRKHDGDVDATISGSPTALLAIRQDSAPLYRGDVTIDGDMSVALAFKKFIASTNIDLEALVAPVVGGTVAHQINRFGTELSSWFRRTTNSFELNVSEYLSEEVEMVATADEVQNYIHEVDDLRSHYDRLLARVALLEKGSSGD